MTTSATRLEDEDNKCSLHAKERERDGKERNLQSITIATVSLRVISGTRPSNLMLNRSYVSGKSEGQVMNCFLASEVCMCPFFFCLLL